MNHELYKLSKDFFNLHKNTILSTIFFSILCSAAESILIPMFVANVFNSIDKPDAFKMGLIKLSLAWISIKVLYIISNYYRKQLEPEITQYITIELITSVFFKYEKENEISNVSVLINKIQLIKKNIQELFYVLCTIFIPRSIVLMLSCYNLYLINKQLGIIIFICSLVSLFITTYKLTECIDVTYEELENKDELYDYIEDLFYNIDTIQSTPNGFNNELQMISNYSNNSKVKEQDAINCINTKQYEGYVSNIIVFIIMIYSIYKLHSDNKLNNTQVTSTVLSLTGLFENIYEITYYIPEVTNKLGVLKSNEQFVKNLLGMRRENNYNNDQIKPLNFNIEFVGVSFFYESHMLLNKFSVIIPENKITCVYGPSGSGKTTFAKLIFGIEKPNEGMIKIGEKDISQYSITSTRDYISYVNQNTSNLFNTTIYKNIIYGHKDTADLRNRIIHIFTEFKFYNIFKSLDENKEMWSFLDLNVGKLGGNVSGGQKEIIFLLRLEINNFTKILILDEPSAALDQVTRDNVVQYILYLKTKGKTILLITHDIFYKDICDNMLMFSNKDNPNMSPF